MIDIFKKDWRAKISTLTFLVLTIWWFVGPLLKKIPDERFLGDPGSIYFVIALLGGLWGFSISFKWGGLKSVMGQSILYFSLGLMAQVFGQIAYAYYPFVLHEPTPYPTVGDIGYFGSILLYIYGAYLLAKASGVNVGLKSFANKIQALIIPLVMLVVGYALFLQGYVFDWSNTIKIILDFGSPLGQAIYMSMAILNYTLTRGVLGGVMKNKVLFILFALLMHFVADWTFLFEASKGTYQVGGLDDYLYFFSYFLMTLALLNLNTQSLKKHLD